MTAFIDTARSQVRRGGVAPAIVEQKKQQAGLALGTGVSTRDVVIFTRQFATMINAGLPLARSLDILARQSENKALRRVVEEVLYGVESGQSLAEAMAAHPRIFSDLYRNMVAAGEAGGILDTILLRLAAFMEKSDALRRKIKGALIYPLVILTVAVGAVIVLLLFVIPTFQEMFQSAGVPMPAPTMLVMAVSDLLQNYWYALLGGLLGCVLLLRHYYRTSGGRLTLDRLLLNLPILGPLQRKVSIARFTRTLGTLASSGVAILDGLEITARTAGNRVVHNAIMSARTSIAGGETISEPLKKSGVFPPMVVQMINVGEQTGGLDEMLTRVADFYDEEVDASVEALLAALEPIMIVFLGLVVGGMIIAMYLPIFDMINAVD
jgi:type IV pilus assembly protein PilC